MFCIAHCELHGAQTGLDGRAHAGDGIGRSERKNNLYGRGISERVREKTNLAMMISALQDMGYRVWTVGDDIAWMKIGTDGYLHAINPGSGLFWSGAGNGRSDESTEMCKMALRENSIFTNVAMTPGGEPWWEGSEIPAPAGLLDWQGRKWDPANGPAAHPNARYTVAGFRNRPSISRAMGRSGRRANIGIFVWRTPREIWLRWCTKRSTGNTEFSWARAWLRETTAAATGKSGSDAARSDGDASLLRVQHGGLFSALAGYGQERSASAKDFSRELVPQRPGRKIPLAGIR